MTILKPKEISEAYAIPISVVYEILHQEGCPIIKGGNGKRFLIEKDAFEQWIKRC